MGRYRPSELAKLGIRPKKRLSQNFLVDQNIIQKTLQAAQISPGDHVLEIGPGPGAITEQLLKAGAQVKVVELDKALAEKLKELQTDDHRLEILCQDVLTLPIDTLKGEKWKIVANLPYHITSPILQKFLPAHELIESLTLFVQKEFALRMTAEKGTKSYSSFTLFIRAYSDPKVCFHVKPTSFSPPPSVDSSVIHLKPHPFPFSFSEEEFFNFTRTGFGKRRKMLRASLKELFAPAMIEEGLIKLRLLKTARPEELSLEDFAALFMDCKERDANQSESP